MTRAAKVILVSLAAVAGGALTVAYYIIDPAESSLMPKCLFKQLTGLDCPGCGSQRMLHALLHGNISAAWAANPLLFAAIPYLLLLAIAAIRRKSWPRLYSALNSPIAIGIILTLLIAWIPIRNFLPIP